MSKSKRSASRTRFYQSQWNTDPTFYPTAKLAMEGPVERYAYVAALAPDQKSRSDALLVVDLDPASDSYGKVAGRIDLPDIGDELHHFGWNACSSALCTYAPHPHVERRYLVVPGLRSSRIHIVDTKPDPREDLSASIWLWNRDNGKWGAKKVIEIPAEPANPDLLPPRSLPI
jgi:hypothetical protein